MKTSVVLERRLELPKAPNSFNVLSVPDGYVIVRGCGFRVPKDSFMWTVQADISEWVRTPRDVRKMDGAYTYAVPVKWYDAHKN